MSDGPQEVVAIVERIKPLLAGHSPEVQAAVLADLLAIWLASQYVERDVEMTHKMRAGLLALHIDTVRRLTAVNAKIIGTPS